MRAVTMKTFAIWMIRQMVLTAPLLLCCGALFGVVPDCHTPQTAFARQIRILYDPSFNPHRPRPEQAVVERVTASVQQLLDQEILRQLNTGPMTTGAERVRKWLRCVQEGFFYPNLTDAPWTQSLQPNGSTVAVGEWLPQFGMEARTYLEIWRRTPTGWSRARWESPVVKNSTYYLHTMKSPIAGEYWFAEWGQVFGNSVGALLLEIAAWRHGRFRQVWTTPSHGILQTSVIAADEEAITVESNFGKYHSAQRMLRRRLRAEKTGLKQVAAWFRYVPSHPAGAPLRPSHLVPLSEPGPRGAPTSAWKP